MRLLFSENEQYYRDLGLVDKPGLVYTFGGCRFYNKNSLFFDKFDSFVCAFYTMPHNVLLTLKFKELNKATILCTDGVFDFSNAIANPMVSKYGVIMYHPIIQSNFLCVGTTEKSYFSNQVSSFNYLPTRVLSKSDMLILPNIKKVLITTANTSYFNDIEFNALCSLMLDTLKVLIKENVLFAVRIFDQKLLAFLESNLQIEFENDIEFDFEKTLEAYSSVITTPSSIAITAMFHKRAVGLLVYRDKPMLLQSGWLIPSGTVFEQNLESFLTLEPQRLNIQTNILKTYLAQEGITELLEELSTSREVIKTNTQDYINQSMLNMLNSSFNFNFEWWVRKLYLRFKSNGIIKKIRLYIR
ncbi:hypothetical protein J8L70_13335 [Pseudoalteromonas sp. MMG010]|uniref:hypothetical protein n=1 Tax=Pseudoalteromonas sp. MMG010 TaxID=2822685 RepID=UPI001B3A5B57|nr:hypothetical protein [Pseudoalteromonas sp. MMG010]MBQ4834230.1 hypothetical protein [Pseudoalteromonas sp. MMG010]